MHSQMINRTYDPLYNFSKEDIIPVKALNKKLNEQTKDKAYVKCVSCLPTSNGRSKEELRINYLYGVIEKKIEDPRYRHLH